MKILSHRNLAFRVLVPIALFTLGCGVAAIWLVNLSVSQFVEKQVMTELRGRASSVYQIIDASLDELQRIGKAGDETAVRLRRVNTLMAIEDFARANQTTVRIVDQRTGRVVEMASNLAPGSEAVADPIAALFGARLREYSHSFRFEPWRWDVTLSQDNSAYLGLLRRLSWGAGIGAIVFVFGMAVFMLYLTALTGTPIRTIIGDLEQHRAPKYRGITEFEYLGDSIANMMNSIREQAQLLQATFDSIGEGLCVFDKELHCLAWNTKFLELYGLPHPAAGDTSELTKMLRAVLDNRTVLPDQPDKDGAILEHTTANGRIVEVFVYSMGDGRMVSTHVDITERRRAQIELTRHRDHLEELVKSRTEELARSNADLEQFAYVTSHDLQEPLRMVGSYMQLVEKRYKEKLDDTGREFINYAVEGAKWMQALINDLLTYSRTGRKGDPFKPTNTDAVLQRALSNLKVAIKESNAQITHDPLPSVTGDATQLTQLFQNLLGNAIKFRGGRAPEIHIGVTQQDAMWRFSVRDNGIGIAPQYHERIFGLFQRLHNRNAYPGTGIGLSVCRKLVERHGGQMWLESQAGTGATFFFTLPRAPSSAAPN